jgi:hypothetical protein
MRALAHAILFPVSLALLLTLVPVGICVYYGNPPCLNIISPPEFSASVMSDIDVAAKYGHTGTEYMGSDTDVVLIWACDRLFRYPEAVWHLAIDSKSYAHFGECQPSGDSSPLPGYYRLMSIFPFFDIVAVYPIWFVTLIGIWLPIHFGAMWLTRDMVRRFPWWPGRWAKRIGLT